MGLNFHVCCHVCKTRLFLYRGEESVSMHKFYRKHEECRRQLSGACEVRADGYSERDWMTEYKRDCLEGELSE